MTQNPRDPRRFIGSAPYSLPSHSLPPGSPLIGITIVFKPYTLGPELGTTYLSKLVSKSTGPGFGKVVGVAAVSRTEVSRSGVCWAQPPQHSHMKRVCRTGELAFASKTAGTLSYRSLTVLIAALRLSCE